MSERRYMIREIYYEIRTYEVQAMNEDHARDLYVRDKEKLRHLTTLTIEPTIDVKEAERLVQDYLNVR